MGSMDKEQSYKLLDAFFEAGGNAIDTANIYRKYIRALTTCPVVYTKELRTHRGRSVRGMDRRLDGGKRQPGPNGHRNQIRISVSRAFPL